MPFDFNISLSVSFGKRPPEIPEPRESSADALVERADPSPAPELRIGFAPRR